MTNIQEINDSDSPEFIFLATNYTKAMDGAAVRAGRISRVVEFPLPTEQCLEVGYERYVAATNTKAKYNVFKKGIDYKSLARQSKGFSYADVAEVVNQTVRAKAYEFLRRHDEEVAQGRSGGVITVPTMSFDDMTTTIARHKKTRRTLDNSMGKTKNFGFGANG